MTLGGDNMVTAPVYGPPFITDLERGRRGATIEDFNNFDKMAQAVEQIHCAGGTTVEPEDLPLGYAAPRHGLLAHPLDGQAVHGQRHLDRERARHDRDGVDDLVDLDRDHQGGVMADGLQARHRLMYFDSSEPGRLR